MDAEIILLLFLIVFMVHEFEEILFVKTWVVKNKDKPKFKRQYWVAAFRKYPMSTATFAALIAEEFVVVGALTLAALYGGFYSFFVGLLVAYGIHLLKHIWDMTRWRAYIPGGPTALVTAPIILWMILHLSSQTVINPWHAAIWATLLSIGMILNLKMLYRLSARIEKAIRP